MIFKFIDERLLLPERLTFESLRGVSFDGLSLPKRFVVDAQAVQACDSVGVAALVWLLREALKQGADVSWQNLPDILLTQLKLYNLFQEGLIYGKCVD